MYCSTKKNYSDTCLVGHTTLIIQIKKKHKLCTRLYKEQSGKFPCLKEEDFNTIFFKQSYVILCPVMASILNFQSY